MSILDIVYSLLELMEELRAETAGASLFAFCHNPISFPHQEEGRSRRRQVPHRRPIARAPRDLPHYSTSPTYAHVPLTPCLQSTCTSAISTAGATPQATLFTCTQFVDRSTDLHAHPHTLCIFVRLPLRALFIIPLSSAQQQTSCRLVTWSAGRSCHSSTRTIT